MSIHSSIRSLRLIKGFSQEYMADKLKISQNAFSRLELGHSGISVKRLHAIADILGTTPEEIIGWSSAEIKNSGKGKNPDFVQKLMEEKDQRIHHLTEEIRFLRERLCASGK